MKKMKWLRKLLILALALILAAMPALMAVPANASSNILTGTPSELVINGESFPMPPVVPGYYAVVVRVNPDYPNRYLTVYYSSIDYALFTYSANDNYMQSNLKWQSSYNLNTNRWTNRAYVSVHFVREDQMNSTVFPIGKPGVLVRNDVRTEVPSLAHLIFGSPGITSVFSGIGSWLSGAVVNIADMFWSADSGMSILGFLAVASLGLALLLLILYLIAGWVKFR